MKVMAVENYRQIILRVVLEVKPTGLADRKNEGRERRNFKDDSFACVIGRMEVSSPEMKEIWEEQVWGANHIVAV